ncbi:MAG: hypothetical protein QNK42_18510 [Pseudodonghicola sp.]|nr:hypothetical protein [Pseudodonghicola sp.]
MSDLDTRLLAAHARGDQSALVSLYLEAADSAGQDQVHGFFLTQAYVYALEVGHAEAPTLRARLVAAGRESA